MTSSLTDTIAQFKSNYPNFKEDFELEMVQQELALQLIELRQKSGFNQSEFAKLVELKQAQLSRLESGSSNPTVASLARLAQKAGYQLKISFEKVAD